MDRQEYALGTGVRPQPTHLFNTAPDLITHLIQRKYGPRHRQDVFGAPCMSPRQELFEKANVTSHALQVNIPVSLTVNLPRVFPSLTI